jgi:hypothetical protein
MRLRRHVGTRIDARDARTYRGGISHPSYTFRLRYIRRRLAHSRPIHRRRSRSRLLLDVLGQLHLIQPGDRSPRHPKTHPSRRVRLPKRAVTICRSRARFGYQELRQPWQRISREAARDAACRRRPRRHEESAAATPARHSRPHHTAPPAPPHWSHPPPPSVASPARAIPYPFFDPFCSLLRPFPAPTTPLLPFKSSVYKEGRAECGATRLARDLEKRHTAAQCSHRTQTTQCGVVGGCAWAFMLDHNSDKG